MSEFVNNEVKVSSDNSDDSSDYEDDKPIEIDKNLLTIILLKKMRTSIEL